MTSDWSDEVDDRFGVSRQKSGAEHLNILYQFRVVNAMLSSWTDGKVTIQATWVQAKRIKLRCWLYGIGEGCGGARRAINVIRQTDRLQMSVDACELKVRR